MEMEKKIVVKGIYMLKSSKFVKMFLGVLIFVVFSGSEAFSDAATYL